METEFYIPVNMDGTEIHFPAKVVHFGFTIRLEIEIENLIVTFEPDEERNWRAVLGFEDLVTGKKVNREMLKLIAAKISQLTKE
jgi:hypothetical protein